MRYRLDMSEIKIASVLHLCSWIWGFISPSRDYCMMGSLYGAKILQVVVYIMNAYLFAITRSSVDIAALLQTYNFC
jgi:uncharacterized membrane protein